ncbi:hypothetical protein SAMN05421805_1374 [Saccharopolyspora antimicrobica]|uniref:Uncharacterized protein n=1 Tax=Saccharopolyspora antimicrobica TaxID=455193 RepID=A0A1I5M5I9_9PSEU|nr:hypothetical protein [Saccharopolyspora antimicrobica]RKT82067.1 hypothetical protein ATL45_0309 [Saccharopolyspora antimicrobica]SFP04908.1 hypothetical protein SAMN05421805_1374 [Saccharopolyspora antimicrobica]
MSPLWTVTACLLSMFTGMTLMYACHRRPQHAGAGEGATNVWQLIEHVEAEARRAEPTGRHHLREPDVPEPPPQWPTTPPETPPLELHYRVLESLRRL